MIILSIETSADETAVSVIRAEGDFPDATYEILGNGLHSQAALHSEYGGIYPTIAKREHAKAITPLCTMALQEAEMLKQVSGGHDIDETHEAALRELLYREPDLTEAVLEFFTTYDQPEIDLIAVTAGPGLEPALWVGVNFAKALAKVWDVPVVPVNHMEGHILASVYDVERDDQLAEIAFPTLALLISGGHTELIKLDGWGTYEKIGETRDDAVGEAFDKVARLLGLPYPGGPEIGKLAALARKAELPAYAELPRPMIGSGDLDFSFSGLKTAVRYAIEERELTETDKQAVARDFEDAVAAVLLKKVQTAIDSIGAKTFIVGGGVSANTYLRNTFNTALLESHPDVEVYFPTPGMSTDNSIMIALAGHARMEGRLGAGGAQHIRADGNRSLDSK
ncbi:tRNA (adenosine(37)-N6)-threonylcarbamoyltransferase complex transferase subunit TsaD [Candidatus Pacebacteria bacterium]|nr:tRNA (adenosine(37)-N6)-threonylcarbamoyltransferase complex transferase subunit TsaD [Candidatus Paceibacterota bacterium]